MGLAHFNSVKLDYFVEFIMEWRESLRSLLSFKKCESAAVNCILSEHLTIKLHRSDLGFWGFGEARLPTRIRTPKAELPGRATGCLRYIQMLPLPLLM